MTRTFKIPNEFYAFEKPSLVVYDSSAEMTGIRHRVSPERAFEMDGCEYLITSLLSPWVLGWATEEEWLAPNIVLVKVDIDAREVTVAQRKTS